MKLIPFIAFSLIAVCVLAALAPSWIVVVPLVALLLLPLVLSWNRRPISWGALTIGLAVATMLAACGTTSLQVQIADGRLAAWTALDTGAIAVDTLAKMGVTTPAEDSALSTDLQRASDDLDAADAAAATADFTSVSSDVASAVNLIVAVEQIVTGKGVGTTETAAFSAAVAKLK